MAKFIGVKMIEAVPMTAREANDKGYRIGNHSFEEDGYEVTYPDGYRKLIINLKTLLEMFLKRMILRDLLKILKM